MRSRIAPVHLLLGGLLLLGPALPEDTASSWPWTGRGRAPAPPPPVTAEPVLTAEGTPLQLDRLSAAVERFTDAGLLLPERLRVRFFDDRSGCGGDAGRFRDHTDPWEILICEPVDTTFEHELAHAWERANLTDEMREGFMDARGLRSWTGRDVPWEARGAEDAANVIRFGVTTRPLPRVLPPTVEADLRAYELLTGSPAPRLVRRLAGRAVPCGDRPTPGSLELPDRDGRRCPDARTPGRVP